VNRRAGEPETASAYRFGPARTIDGRQVQRAAVALRVPSSIRVGYQAPDEIIILDAMPTNALGKVDRVALKHLADAAVKRQLS
jgi:acyl-coenzyme A synthetase/AMP-(fatty) acid ligase